MPIRAAHFDELGIHRADAMLGVDDISERKLRRATRKIFASSSIPNQRMTSGIRARCGTLRIICNVLSRNSSDRRDKPLASPSTKPMPPADGEAYDGAPEADPDILDQFTIEKQLQPAAKTSVGAGRTRTGINPVVDKACQTPRIPSGNIHCVKEPNRPAVSLAHDCAACLSSGR